jgi:uncharacterized protein YwqG
MDRNEIVEQLARQRRVENFVQYYARSEDPADREDLAQIVYLALLKMDEEKLRDLHASGDLDFYIRRVIRTQLYGRRTDYEREIKSFKRRTTEINERSHTSQKNGELFIGEGTWDYYGISDK